MYIHVQSSPCTTLLYPIRNDTEIQLSVQQFHAPVTMKLNKYYVHDAKFDIDDIYSVPPKNPNIQVLDTAGRHHNKLTFFHGSTKLYFCCCCQMQYNICLYCHVSLKTAHGMRHSVEIIHAHSHANNIALPT